MSQSEIDDAKRAIVRCAWEWWRSKRPLGFSPQDHLTEPTIGTLTPSEKTLRYGLDDSDQQERTTIQ